MSLTLPEYHKINGIFKRDEKGKFIMGDFARPEYNLLLDVPWLWTEKVDGTNVRVRWGQQERVGIGPAGVIDGFIPYIEIGGRTDRANLHPDLIARLHELFPPEIADEFFGGAARELVFYGEGYGAGIQKGGGNYSSDKDFIVFDIRANGYWLERANVEGICSQLGLRVVPQLGVFTLRDALEGMDSGAALLYNSFWPGVPTPEGWVGVPAVQLFNRFGERIITKLKTVDFQ